MVIRIAYVGNGFGCYEDLPIPGEEFYIRMGVYEPTDDEVLALVDDFLESDNCPLALKEDGIRKVIVSEVDEEDG